MLQNPVFRCFIGALIGFLLIFGVFLAILVTRHVLEALRKSRIVRRWRTTPALLLLLPLALLAGGCASSGMIRASEVDYTFRRVADRHDAYVNADASITPLAKTVALQQTAALRGVLDEAKKTATTLPAK